MQVKALNVVLALLACICFILVIILFAFFCFPGTTLPGDRPEHIQPSYGASFYATIFAALCYFISAVLSIIVWYSRRS